MGLCMGQTPIMIEPCHPPQKKWREWIKMLPEDGRKFGKMIIEGGGEIISVNHAGGMASFDNRGNWQDSHDRGNYRYMLEFKYTLDDNAPVCKKMFDKIKNRIK